MGKMIAKPGLKQLILVQHGTLEAFSIRIGYARHTITNIHQGKKSASLFLAEIIAESLGKPVEELFDFQPSLKTFLRVNIRRIYEQQGYTSKTFSDAVGITESTLLVYQSGKKAISFKAARSILRALKLDDTEGGKDFKRFFTRSYDVVEGNRKFLATPNMESKREDIGYMHKFLAKELECDIEFIDMVESGKISVDEKMAKNICKILKCTIFEIFDLEVEEYENSNN